MRKAGIGWVGRCTSENGTSLVYSSEPRNPGVPRKNLGVGEWSSTIPLVTHGPPSLCSQSSQSQLPFETQPGPGQLQCPRVPAIQLTLYIAISTASKRAGCQMKGATKSVRFKVDIRAEAEAKAKGGKIGLPSPSQAVGE